LTIIATIERPPVMTVKIISHLPIRAPRGIRPATFLHAGAEDTPLAIREFLGFAHFVGFRCFLSGQYGAVG
jgi:hypothetical protein